MEITRTLSGTQQEMSDLFLKCNVRNYKEVNGRFEVTIRVSEDFNPDGIKTVKNMKKAILHNERVSA